MEPLDVACTSLGRTLELRARYEHLAREPFDTDSMHALFRAYRRAGDVDEAWCVASTLVFLHRATAEEDAFHVQHRRTRLPRSYGRLTEQQRRDLVVHPDEDPTLTSVIGLIAPAVAAWRATEVLTGPRAQGPLDPATDRSRVPQLVGRIADALHVMRPEVYLVPGEPGDATLVAGKRHQRIAPTLIVFEGVLGCDSERGVAFDLGVALDGMFLPHFCLATLEQSSRALKVVLMACLHGVGVPVSGDRASLEVIAGEIFARLTPAARHELRLRLFRLTAGEQVIDVDRWVAASRLTACRVGLLMCGDLRVAAQRIAQAQPRLQALRPGPRDKLAELVVYGLSPAYFEARKALGVALGS